MSDSTILSIIKRRRIPRDEWAREYLDRHYLGQILEEIEGEGVETFPPELQDDLALFFEEPASDKEANARCLARFQRRQ